jgi:hypothetical protein
MVAVNIVREIANLISSDNMAEANAERFVKRLDEAIIATYEKRKEDQAAKSYDPKRAQPSTPFSKQYPR